MPAKLGSALLPSPFALTLGGTLSQAAVPYEIIGPPGKPVVVVLGGISADRHVRSNAVNSDRGWWEAFVGPGRPIDTDQFRVLGISFLGRPGTLGPVRQAGGPVVLSPLDQARALREVIRHENLGDLAAVVGSSLGGTVALSFALHYPTLLRSLVIIGAAHRPHPMATALRSLQRRIARFGRGAGRAKEGLAVARALALTTYRSSTEFADRFDPFPTAGDVPLSFECERYLAHNGDRWAEDFDLDCFLLLSECLDAANEEPHRLDVPTTAISFQDDSIVPGWLVKGLVDQAGPVARHVSIPTRYGHDAFLKEVNALRGPLSQALNVAGAS